MTASTTTPRHNTNARNGTSSAAAIRRELVSRRANARTPRTTAPASAAHAGDNPNSDVTANPTSVSASTTSTNTGTARLGRRRRASARPKLAREKPTQQHELDRDRGQPGQRHHRGEVDERQARRGERQQVGQVRHRQQQRGGVRQMRGGVRVRPRSTRNARAVASTTGVSSTTVASRLRIAVVAAAITKTFASKRW